MKGCLTFLAGLQLHKLHTACQTVLHERYITMLLQERMLLHVHLQLSPESQHERIEHGNGGLMRG
jgi:hypothetical protein